MSYLIVVQSFWAGNIVCLVLVAVLSKCDCSSRRDVSGIDETRFPSTSGNDDLVVVNDLGSMDPTEVLHEKRRSKKRTRELRCFDMAFDPSMWKPWSPVSTEDREIYDMLNTYASGSVNEFLDTCNAYHWRTNEE